MIGALRVTAVAVPASSSSACSGGEITFDASFFYVCVSTNAWRRVGIATF